MAAIEPAQETVEDNVWNAMEKADKDAAEAAAAAASSAPPSTSASSSSSTPIPVASKESVVGLSYAPGTQDQKEHKGRAANAGNRIPSSFQQFLDWTIDVITDDDKFCEVVTGFVQREILRAEQQYAEKKRAAEKYKKQGAVVPAATKPGQVVVENDEQKNNESLRSVVYLKYLTWAYHALEEQTINKLRSYHKKGGVVGPTDMSLIDHIDNLRLTKSRSSTSGYGMLLECEFTRQLGDDPNKKVVVPNYMEFYIVATAIGAKIGSITTDYPLSRKVSSHDQLPYVDFQVELARSMTEELHRLHCQMAASWFTNAPQFDRVNSNKVKLGNIMAAAHSFRPFVRVGGPRGEKDQSDEWKATKNATSSAPLSKELKARLPPAYTSPEQIRFIEEKIEPLYTRPALPIDKCWPDTVGLKMKFVDTKTIAGQPRLIPLLERIFPSVFPTLQPIVDPLSLTEEGHVASVFDLSAKCTVALGCSPTMQYRIDNRSGGKSVVELSLRLKHVEILVAAPPPRELVTKAVSLEERKASREAARKYITCSDKQENEHPAEQQDDPAEDAPGALSAQPHVRPEMQPPPLKRQRVDGESSSSEMKDDKKSGATALPSKTSSSSSSLSPSASKPAAKPPTKPVATTSSTNKKSGGDDDEEEEDE